LGDLGIDGRVILNRISKKQDMDWIHVAQNKDQWWTLCEYGNEPSTSIQGNKFIKQVNEYWLLKDSDPWN
jgi:hypothetical protein